ncbi:uncharacterized protein I303_101660 [Kwoniella dejecticola CBS 10117]|uniref:Uncharacterized protein n=1 Tax=Kwoniella dejecticola CBS 10117 TaxID=1296121 RepID=A0A1A6AD43_9TREE|nr:uncharacterized protein I303_02203 [Kwoniella dejecticola CBS 10117]OBR87987.1 hypothetical protein I303_02203 [Kwoniella dejecticola CBS 10117]
MAAPNNFFPQSFYDSIAAAEEAGRMAAQAGSEAAEEAAEIARRATQAAASLGQANTGSSSHFYGGIDCNSGIVFVGNQVNGEPMPDTHTSGDAARDIFSYNGSEDRQTGFSSSSDSGDDDNGWMKPPTPGPRHDQHSSRTNAHTTQTNFFHGRIDTTGQATTIVGGNFSGSFSLPGIRVGGSGGSTAGEEEVGSGRVGQVNNFFGTLSSNNLTGGNGSARHTRRRARRGPRHAGSSDGNAKIPNTTETSSGAGSSPSWNDQANKVDNVGAGSSANASNCSNHDQPVGSDRGGSANKRFHPYHRGGGRSDRSRSVTIAGDSGGGSDSETIAGGWEEIQ